MQQTLILLMSVREFDRRDEVEYLDSSNITYYDHMSQTVEVFGKTCRALTLSEFVEECNNQEIELQDYWITYAMIKP